MNNYQELAKRTLKADTPELTHDEMMIVWVAIGLAGEVGELVDYLKKGIFHKHGLDIDHVKKELGDISWYHAGLCTLLGLDLDDVHNANIEKLKARYPNGFSFEDSFNRDE